MNCILLRQSVCTAALAAAFGFGCASHEPELPPLKLPPPASSPAEIEQALPGVWGIDVDASADALARAQFLPRQVATLRRDSDRREFPEAVNMAPQFDAKVYREARGYWLNLLHQPDMKWRLVFQPGGTGEHWAVATTGQPLGMTPFKWRLDGWRLCLDYAGSPRFRDFNVAMTSAVEMPYPMVPLGDHLVLRPERKSGSHGPQTSGKSH